MPSGFLNTTFYFGAAILSLRYGFESGNEDSWHDSVGFQRKRPKIVFFCTKEVQIRAKMVRFFSLPNLYKQGTFLLYDIHKLII